MGKGADRNTILGFAVRADPSLRNDPKFRAWVDEALAYRKKHPGAKYGIDPSFYTSEVPLSQDEQNRNAGAQTGLAAALLNAGDAATAGNLGNIMGEDADRALAVTQQQHPGASLAGSLAGGIGAGAAGEAALGGLGMAGGLLRSGISDAIYGGAAGASNPDGNSLGNITQGALAGALGGFAGNKLASGLGSAVHGVASPAVGYVNREVPGALTVGQAVGQSGRVGAAVKGIEDRLSGLPVVGDVVNARRLEGIQKMNSKAFDKALEPINEKVSGKFGEEAVADAQDKVSAAFGKALKGKAAGIDHGFIVEAARAKNAIEKLPDSVRGRREQPRRWRDKRPLRRQRADHWREPAGSSCAELARDQARTSYQSTPVRASHWQGDRSSLRWRRKPVPSSGSGRDAAVRTRRRKPTAHLDARRRREPRQEQPTAIRCVHPGQLGMSDRANTVKFGGKSGCCGKSEFHEFHKNMQEVLPNKVPDSGTAGRIILPAAAIGALVAVALAQHRVAIRRPARQVAQGRV
jgi:hypothetical protein